MKRILLYLLVLILFFIGGVAYYYSEYIPIVLAQFQSVDKIPYEKKHYKNSYLEYQNNTPILHLYGSASERGEAIGHLMGKQIQHLIDKYIKILHSGEKYQKAIQTAYQLEKHIPREYILEMKGISKGSGIAYKDILLANTFLEMLFGVMCSTFVVQKEQSDVNTLIFGRNLDFPSMNVAHLYDLIMVYHLENKNSLVIIGWPGMIGAISGMNQKGLAATMLVSLSEQRPNFNNIPSTLAFRQVLESYGSVKEVVDYFKKTKIASPNNLTVADAHNKSVVIELSPNYHNRMRYPSGNALYCTNYFLDKKGSQEMYSKKDTRYTSLGKFSKEFIVKNKKIGVSDIKNILKQTALGGTNLQTMISLPVSKTMYLSMEEIPAALGRYQKFSIDHLLRSKLIK